MANKTSKTVWIGRVISLLAMPLFLYSSFMKLKGGPEFEQGMVHMGLPVSMGVSLAILELSCVALYLFPSTAVLGAILLAGYMGGAICTHWRIGEPFYAQIGLGVAVWLGLWLREPRLRQILPLRF